MLAAAASGDFRRFERFVFSLIVGSLLLLPVLVAVHPDLGGIAHDLVTPVLPKISEFQDVMLLMVAIVGAAIAPWQLFFQQSYVIDKGISAAVLRFARADLWIGIVLALAVAASIMIIAATTFAGRPEFGHFVDTGAVADAISRYFRPTIGVLFALALIDACMIGAAAVTLSTAYAIGDVMALRHSLRSRPGDARIFYLVYFGLIAVAACVVLIPDAPIGLFINAVQALAGVLLPSSTVFLLLLCNDPAVIGPWINSRWRNAVTGIALGGQMLISALMTVSVVFPHSEDQRGVSIVFLVGGMIGLILGIPLFLLPRPRAAKSAEAVDPDFCARWRMPPLDTLAPATMPLAARNWLAVLRLYLIFACGLVALRLLRLVMA
jgi:Mn2+/Fe2+ NRAMP family transporter